LRIAIAGGSGFVGNALTTFYLNQGHDVYILTRNNRKKVHHPNLSYVEWLNPTCKPEESLESLDVFVNLAGESINSGRWNKERKRHIRESRIIASREVFSILSKLKVKPPLLINASAIGFYGTSLDNIFTEHTNQSGTDFLAGTVHDWEQEAVKAEKLGIRVALLRFGIILGNDGALSRMVLPYKFFIGGTIGTGKQWLSWIHINDVVRIVDFVINHEIDGPINVTSPKPKNMKEFGQTISTVLKRPHWLPVPQSVLRLALGEMSILVLEGQQVLPTKLLKSGFTFTYENLEDALKDILN
jgi:uncharacterized protein